MTTDDIIEYFKNSYRFKEKTGMSCSTYLNWMKKGFVPLKSQIQLELITKGELKADWVRRQD